jgi:hypothetical protein
MDGWMKDEGIQVSENKHNSQVQTNSSNMNKAPIIKEDADENFKMRS